MEKVIINSIEEYIREVINLNSNNFFNSVADCITVYRGQSNSEWKIIPAVFRDLDDYLNEGLYLKEFQRQFPEECNNLTLFDILVKAQHYGIPTRLLDLTLNPLIALYFACEKNFDNDGSVYVFCDRALFGQETIPCEIVVNYLFKCKKNASWNNQDALKICRILNINPDITITLTDNEVNKILSDKLEHLFISPKLTNNRIKAQKGVFSLMNVPLGENKKSFLFPQKDIEISLKPSKTLIIPKNLKEEIMFNLSILGVDRYALFPELDSSAVNIVNKIKSTNMGAYRRTCKNIF